MAYVHGNILNCLIFRALLFASVNFLYMVNNVKRLQMDQSAYFICCCGKNSQLIHTVYASLWEKGISCCLDLNPQTLTPESSVLASTPQKKWEISIFFHCSDFVLC